MDAPVVQGWAGVDVGKGHHWVCLNDAAGTTLWSSKVLNLNPPIGRGGSARHEVRMPLRSGKIGLLQDPNLHHHEGHLVDETVPHPHVDFHGLR